jgi:hypothetical protein
MEVRAVELHDGGGDESGERAARRRLAGPHVAQEDRAPGDLQHRMHDLLSVLGRQTELLHGAERLDVEVDARVGVRQRSFAVRSGDALRPFDRLLPRLHLDQPVAGDQLLRLGEGSVDHGALSSGELDARALRARLEPGEVEQDAGFRQLLVVLRHFGNERLARRDARFRVLVGFDYHHESHRRVSFSVRIGAGLPSGPRSTGRRTRCGEIDTRLSRRSPGRPRSRNRDTRARTGGIPRAGS